MTLATNSQVGVIGGGISGLTFSYFLSYLRPDVHITILELSNRTGGHILSKQTGVGLFEKGPHTLRGNSDGTLIMLDLFKKFGRQNEVFGIGRSSEANNKYLVNDDLTLLQVPGSLLWTLKFLVRNSWILWLIITEPFRKIVKVADESVESFFNRRFGPGISDHYVSAIFHGIYAGDVGKLSAKTILGKMFKVEQENNMSLFGYVFRVIFGFIRPPKVATILDKYQEYSFDNVWELKKQLAKYPIVCFKYGLESATELLRNQLSCRTNVEIIYNCQVQKIQKHGKLVVDYIKENKEEAQKEFDVINSTISAKDLSGLVGDGLSQALRKVEFVHVLLINIYIDKDVLKNKGFGYLVPKSYDTLHPDNTVLGVIFDLDMEKYRTPVFDQSQEILDDHYTKLTVMMGGHHWDKAPENLSEQVEQAKKVVSRHLGISLDDCISELKLTKNCIPQYNVGYDEIKQQALEASKKMYGDNLILTGMCFNGIGVPDCISMGFQKALELK